MCLNWLSRGRGGCFRRRQYIRCAPDRKLEAIPRERRGEKTNNIGRPASAVDDGRGRQDEEAEHAEKPVRRDIGKKNLAKRLFTVGASSYRRTNMGGVSVNSEVQS